MSGISADAQAGKTEARRGADQRASVTLDATLIALTPDGIVEFFRQMTGACRERLQGYVNQVKEANRRSEMIGRCLGEIQPFAKGFEKKPEDKAIVLAALRQLKKDLGGDDAPEAKDIDAMMAKVDNGDDIVTAEEMNAVVTSLKTIQTHYTDLNAEVMLDVQKLSGQVSQMTSLCSNLLQNLNQSALVPINNLK
jgi:arginyl-tRNA synthetase